METIINSLSKSYVQLENASDRLTQIKLAFTELANISKATSSAGINVKIDILVQTLSKDLAESAKEIGAIIQDMYNDLPTAAVISARRQEG